MKKYEYILPLLLILMPPFVMASLIYRYGIDIPFWDHWGLVPLLHKLHFGELTFYDLWKQEGNEHRILFPKIIMLALAYISNWNIWFELYANLVFGGIILFFLYLLLKYTFENYNKKLILYLSAMFSFLVFSPMQCASYVQGWKFQMFLAALSPIVTVWALYRYPNSAKGIIIAILSAIIGSYSYITGLFIWFTGGILLFQNKRNWKYIIVWFFFAIVTITLHCYKSTKPERDLLLFINYPIYFIGFILAYIGSTFPFLDEYLSVITGIFLIFILSAGIIIIWYRYKEDFAKVLPWVSLALYVFLSSIITSVGRLTKGEFYSALSSHYITISTLFAISTLVVMVVCIKNYLKENDLLPAKFVIILFSVCILFTYSYVLTFLYTINELQNREKYVNLAKYCLLNQDKCDAWKILYPNKTRLVEMIKMLEQIPYKGGIKK